MGEEEFWKHCYNIRTRFMVETFVFLCRAAIERFGDKEAREAIRKSRYDHGFYSGRRMAKKAEEEGKEKNLATFIELMKLVELPWTPMTPPEKTAKKFSSGEIPYCRFAALLKDMNAEDLGELYCAWDDGAVAGFNPKMKITTPKYLWRGDGRCIHIWELEE